MNNSIRSIEYISKKTNDYSIDNINAFLVLNQKFSLDSFVDKFPVVSDNKNFSRLLYISGNEAPNNAPHPLNGILIRLELELGKIISSAQMDGGINFFHRSANYSSLKLDMFSIGVQFDY